MAPSHQVPPQAACGGVPVPTRSSCPAAPSQSGWAREPTQPLQPSTLGERGSWGQAAFAPRSRSRGSPSHHGGVLAATGRCSGCRLPARPPATARGASHRAGAETASSGGRGASLPALAACENNPGPPRAGAAEKHVLVRGGSELPSRQPHVARPKATAPPALRSPGAVPVLGAKGQGRVPHGQRGRSAPEPGDSSALEGSLRSCCQHSPGTQSST